MPEQMRVNISDARTRSKQTTLGEFYPWISKITSFTTVGACVFPPTFFKYFYLFIYLFWIWHKVQTSTLVPFQRSKPADRGEGEEGYVFFYDYCFRFIFIYICLYIFGQRRLKRPKECARIALFASCLFGDPWTGWVWCPDLPEEDPESDAYFWPRFFFLNEYFFFFESELKYPTSKKKIKQKNKSTRTRNFLKLRTKKSWNNIFKGIGQIFD